MILKKTRLLFSSLLLITATVSSCSQGGKADGGILINGESVTITDSLNQQIIFNEIPTNAVFLQSSLAVPWLLCDGKIKGICSDYKEYELDTKFGINDQNTSIIGKSAHSPDKAKILECNPDVVFYSPDISIQKETAVGIQEAGFKVCAIKIEKFQDYLDTLKKFSAILTRSINTNFVNDYGRSIKQKIENIKAKANGKHATAIAFRARSGGYTIFREESDHFIMEILKDLNIENKADVTWNRNLFEIPKLEASHPDFIFYFYMGNENDDAIEKNIDETIRTNPVWDKNKERLLTKKYFHYKPNNEWDKAYEEVYNIVYGE